MVTVQELDAVAIVSALRGALLADRGGAEQQGKHVFSEKPLGITMEQCLQAEAAVSPAPGIGVYAGLYAAL